MARTFQFMHVLQSNWPILQSFAAFFFMSAGWYLFPCAGAEFQLLNYPIVVCRSMKYFSNDAVVGIALALRKDVNDAAR
jgi:hypothetical protein